MTSIEKSKNNTIRLKKSRIGGNYVGSCFSVTQSQKERIVLRRFVLLCFRLFYDSGKEANALTQGENTAKHFVG